MICLSGLQSHIKSTAILTPSQTKQDTVIRAIAMKVVTQPVNSRAKVMRTTFTRPLKNQAVEKIQKMVANFWNGI